jgi:hypothetical protein
MPNVKLVNGIHPNSLTWDKPMTSAQAMRYWTTYGLIPAELYEADLRRQRHTISQLQAAFDDAYEALMQARQESYFVREYLDEARDWIKTILEEAEAAPHTAEEWRDGLCRGSIGAVMTKCKAALSELPQGSEVVFMVRRRLAAAKESGIEPPTERLTGGDQLTADTPQAAATQADAKSTETAQ